jgi:hypothetical protein
MSRLFALLIGCLVVFAFAGTGQAESPSRNCAIPSRETPRHTEPTSTCPECATELTCTDRPVLLGHPRGMCFRAPCSGVWALLHTRLDQTSFDRRFFSYRQFQFGEGWDLKDQGTIEAGPVAVRELFLVLAGDLIEFTVAEPVPHARIEVRNLGYIRKGTVAELQQWLAYQTYWENLEGQRCQQPRSSNQDAKGRSDLRTGCGSQEGILSRVLAVRPVLGFPFSP